MSALREAANKMLKMLEEASLADPALAAEIIYKIGAALPSFRAALAQEQDAELSAALGWPGGISTPALDRKRLLQMVAALRVSAQQALEALEEYQSKGAPFLACDGAVDALRAALAQEQAGPKPMHPELRKMWEEHFDRCFRAMPLPAQEQAEPLNLSDRAVQKRLAAQWGYVPAEQAEPDHETRAELAEQQVVQLAEERDHYRNLWQKAQQAEPVQEPHTGDVTRIMREAGMTFHLGLPHKAVVEQMTRVIDLVYAEASIKAAQQFASALAQEQDPEPVQEPVTWVASEDGYTIQDNCFTHDVVLRVSGDFENDEQRIRRAKRIVDALNAAPPRRTMLPLTEEEILAAVGWERAEMYMKLTPNFPVDEAKKETLKNARAIEKASWEKNK